MGVEGAQQVIDEILMEAITMNTAHPKSSVRKTARSCIAYYVWHFKNLKNILGAFKKYGIEMNENVYSKQCVILILPNLLNLDQSVINE